MKTSETIDQLSTAFSAAQGAFTNPERNREVKTTAYSFSYSTLDAVVDAVRGPLAKNGLSVIQPAEMVDGVLVVTTRLLHASGQWVESDLCAKPADLSPQKIGSVITYLRRYALCGLLGIASEEDDDGQHGGAVTTAKPKAAKNPNGTQQPSTPADEVPKPSVYERMRDKAKLETDDVKLGEMAKWTEATDLMSREEKDIVIAAIMARRKQIEAVAEPSLRH